MLLAAHESECPITQIAVTDLCAGEEVEAHLHRDMQEGFYVLSGELDIILDGITEHCRHDDFIYVRSGSRHELRAVTNVKVMTIGCEIG